MADGTNKRLLTIGGAFVVGLLIGWLLLGWLLFPVTYTNAYLLDVRPEDQQVYLQAVAEGYELTRDVNVANSRLQLLGSRQYVTDLTASAIDQAEQNSDLATANRLRNLAASAQLDLAGAAPPVEAAAGDATPEEGGGSRLLTICGGGLGLLAVLGGIVLVAYLLSNRASGRKQARSQLGSQTDAARNLGGSSSDIAATFDWEETSKPARPASPRAAGGAPIQQYTATFNLGDTNYDESFDIDVASLGYLGECGMSFSEGVNGDTNRATALEVWLFDKSDIRTVTTVLASDYAFGNQAMRDKLSARGDTILAQPGVGFVLDAQTLRLEGEIAELEYAEGEAPARSAFRRVAVDLRVIRQPSA